MKYESICYMDTDVYIQGSFDAIWTECRQNIMLYDINHGLNTRDYVLLCDEIESSKETDYTLWRRIFCSICRECKSFC